MGDLDEQQRSFWPALRRQNPRGIGLALFAVGLLVYGLVTADRQAITIALIVGVIVGALLVVPAAMVSRRARHGKSGSP